VAGAELDAHADANDAVQSGKALVDIIKAGSAGGDAHLSMRLEVFLVLAYSLGTEL